jgi:hypothetical protein
VKVTATDQIYFYKKTVCCKTGQISGGQHPGTKER